MATFDLNILPIHRNNGLESADLPGLLAMTPPRKTARGREKDNLIIYLMLSGNATFSTNELSKINNNAAGLFFQSAGSLTSAMRRSAENLNLALLERNLATTGRGQYALGLLVLAVIRENQCTLLLSGATHTVWVSEGQSRHIYDPALSGKGLGSSQNIQTYLSQVELRANDLLVLCGKFPKDWEADLMNERPSVSLESSYRKLTLTKGDLNAALIQIQSGPGIISVLRAEVNTAHRPQPEQGPAIEKASLPESLEPHSDEIPITNYQSPAFAPHAGTDDSESSITEEELDELTDFAAHMIQPSAYAIPPQPENIPALPPKDETTSKPSLTAPRNFPPSIPRVNSNASNIVSTQIEEPEEDVEEEAETEEPVSVTASAAIKPEKPDAHAIATRQMAKVMVGGIQTGRRMNERVNAFLRRFVPRLLPGPEGQTQQQLFFMPTYAMIFMAIVIPLILGTIGSVVYLSLGQSVQYDTFYRQAQGEATRALSETDLTRQREAWGKTLEYLDQAEKYRKTDNSRSLRTQAQSGYDTLMGIVRLEFAPAFTSGLGGSNQISRMAASESDLYMLDAERGNILHAAFTGRSLELDTAFNCQPGTYAGYQVSTLVDLLALPKINAAGATVLGIDATGNLLYCAPGQVPQAIPLPALPNTNWGRINSFALDSGNLYVLDATSRAVWVFVGKDSAFVDTPYFYFGNQIPNIDNAIDLAVSGDDLYLLHADGHLSTCTFSRIAETPTRCIDPVIYQDAFPAHQGLNVFAQAHFTQMSLTNLPNSVVLLLDSENQSVFRFSPRSLELQNQISGHAGEGNPFQSGVMSAMTVSPNYILYLAIRNQVYFATNLP
ncbi:MAG TPA: hypothetical protein VN653_19720 [Anaerolineales bacterium]|nr:hypothetical protein [Anaerolineales bacterium]